jgi:hypothetical protein
MDQVTGLTPERPVKPANFLTVRLYHCYGVAEINGEIVQTEWQYIGAESSSTAERAYFLMHPDRGLMGVFSVDNGPLELFMDGEPVRSVRCPNCQMVSYNLNDLQQQYCGYCKRFHADFA